MTEAREHIERLKHRRELRSAGEDELSEVIAQEARKRMNAPSSTPPQAKWFVAILAAVTDWKRLVVALAIIAALTFLLVKGVRWTPGIAPDASRSLHP